MIYMVYRFSTSATTVFSSVLELQSATWRPEFYLAALVRVSLLCLHLTAFHAVVSFRAVFFGYNLLTKYVR